MARLVRRPRPDCRRLGTALLRAVEWDVHCAPSSLPFGSVPRSNRCLQKAEYFCTRLTRAPQALPKVAFRDIEYGHCVAALNAGRVQRKFVAHAEPVLDSRVPHVGPVPRAGSGVWPSRWVPEHFPKGSIRHCWILTARRTAEWLSVPTVRWMNANSEVSF